MTTISTCGASLFVKRLGRGTPVALMHGGPGVDHTTMRPFLPLASRHTLVFYDHRCNGRSTGETASMTWENLTADAEELRQSLGFDRWAVLGHSFGGMVALEYALRYPESLSHLILMDTCGDSEWVQARAPQALANRGFDRRTVDLARRFFNGRIEPHEMQSAMRRFGGAYYHRPTVRLLAHEVFRGIRMKTRPEALIFGFGQLLRGWNIMSRLGEISAPTLVLSGRYDFQFPPEHQAALACGIPGARLEIIENAGHNAHSERPDAVNETVLAFLAEV